MLLHESDHYVVQKFRQLKQINLEFIHQNFKKITKSKGLKQPDQHNIPKHQILN